jgi:hypothetical protein
MLRETANEAVTRSGVNPYVFIVGCPRSGTTLLQRIVDAHPHIAVTHEQHWLPRYFKERIGLTPEGLVTPELVPSLLERKRTPMAQLGVSREDLEGLIPPGEPLPFAAFVSGLFDLYGRRRGKRLVGDKTPNYARELPTLHALWPRAKVVHILRDGRDVALSVLAHLDKLDRATARFVRCAEDTVSTAALYWKWTVLAGREAGGALGPELYYEIAYEALMARPAEECARLCAFLGVPSDEAMLRFHEGKARPNPGPEATAGLDAKAAWLPVTPGLRDWRSQMPAEDGERFEAAAGDLLDELGYPRAVPRPRPERLEQASLTREAFTREARKRFLPARW